jgi:hypothetical protein
VGNTALSIKRESVLPLDKAEMDLLWGAAVDSRWSMYSMNVIQQIYGIAFEIVEWRKCNVYEWPWITYLFICRLKINHDIHEFIYEISTVANSYRHIFTYFQSSAAWNGYTINIVCPLQKISDADNRDIGNIARHPDAFHADNINIPCLMLHVTTIL